MINESGLVSHYSKFEYFENILADGLIKFSAVENLEDPRESSLGWIDTVGLGHDINTIEWKKARALKKSVGQNLKIFCTTLPASDKVSKNYTLETKIYGKPRMWAQYGDSFRGFCILFKKDSLVRNISTTKQSGEFIASDKVEYYDWLNMVSGGSTIEYGQNIELKSSDLLGSINQNSMLKSIYFKKGIDWENESEYRWIYYSERKNIFVDIKNSIHSVVLGNRFPRDSWERAKNLCKELKCNCYMLDYQHPRYKLIEWNKS